MLKFYPDHMRYD